MSYHRPRPGHLMLFDPATHTVHAAGRTWQADPAHTTIDDQWYDDLPGWTGHPDYGHRTRRCRIRFETGWEASIVWGSGTYSTNHDAFHRDDPFTEQPDTVEVGVCDHTGELRMRHHDDDDGDGWHDVETYLDDDALAALLDQLAALPTDHDYGQRPPTAQEVTALARDYAEKYDPAALPLLDPPP